MEHAKKSNRREAKTRLFLAAFFLPLLISACGGIVPPPPKKAGTAPQDKPLVVSTIPSTDEEGVILNKSVSVTFSKEMSSETLNNTTFSLNGGTGTVSGTVTLTGTTAIFKPTSNLKESTLFTATVTQGVQDTFGNFIAEELTWTFTTAAINDPGSTDTVPPFVVATDPADGETNVSLNASSISVTFSEAIDPSTVIALGNETDTFTINRGTTAKEILLSADSRTFTFVPDDILKGYEEILSGTITTGVKDLAGNPISPKFTWSFTIEKDPVGAPD